MRTSVRLPALLFVGALLMQLAWILALPPFGGIDEFDHAYRAAEVARGEWLADPVQAVHGRGLLVAVPVGIVSAAGPECARLPYTAHDDCNPVGQLGNGMVTVASSAARYNPAFYWAIGTPARMFDGGDALYAMRAMAALLCSAFIALAGWAISRWARTVWPLVAMLTALTPVVMYSTAVAAPNGIEMCAALALWVTLLGLTRPLVTDTSQRALLWAALPSAVVLATVRSLGPVWLLLLVVTVLVALGPSRTIDLVRRHRLTVGVVTSLVAVASLASVWWTWTARTLASEPYPIPFPNPVGNSLLQSPVWFLQSIAAFPYRNDQAPTVVYATGSLVVLALVGLGVWAARGRLRGALLGALAVSVAFPLAVTLATYAHRGPIWQGRYGLPFSFGVIVIAGLALEGRRPRHRLLGPALVCGWVCLTVAHTVSVAGVLHTERLESPLAHTSAWLTPQLWVVVALTVAGWLCWGAAARETAAATRAEAESVPADWLEGTTSELTSLNSA